MRSNVINNNELKTAEKEAEYLYTIQQLRAHNFESNLPFLIVSGSLPEGQVYREFPDGRVELQQMSPDGPSFHFQLVRELDASEASKLREEYGLC